MPHTQTVTLTLPTYAEIRERAMAEWIENTPRSEWPSTIGLGLIAWFQQDAAKEMDWYNRRAALLGARAKFSIVRHLEYIYAAEGIDPSKRKSA